MVNLSLELRLLFVFENRDTYWSVRVDGTKPFVVDIYSRQILSLNAGCIDL